MKKKPRNLPRAIALSLLGLVILLGTLLVISTPYVPPTPTAESHTFTKQSNVALPYTLAPTVTEPPPSPKPESQEIIQIDQTVGAGAAPAKQQEPRKLSVPLHNGNGVVVDLPEGTMVWESATGHSFHTRNDCGNMNPQKARYVTVEKALRDGRDACDKCYG